MRVLLVAAGLPFPSDTGGKIRTINTLRLLTQRHDVTTVALVPPGAGERAIEDTRAWAGRLIPVPWAETAKGTAVFYAELGVNLASRLPYVIAKHSSRRMRTALAQLERNERFDALICDFLFPAINTFHLTTRPRVLFQHNLETRIWERYVATKTSALRRSYFDLQRRRLARFERLACSTYDHCIAVSETDGEAMLRDFGARAVSVIPTMTGTRLRTRAHVSRINRRRSAWPRAGASPVVPRMNRPCTPPPRMCSTSRWRPSSSIVPRSCRGVTIGG